MRISHRKRIIIITKKKKTKIMQGCKNHAVRYSIAIRWTYDIVFTMGNKKFLFMISNRRAFIVRLVFFHKFKKKDYIGLYIKKQSVAPRLAMVADHIVERQ